MNKGVKIFKNGVLKFISFFYATGSWTRSKLFDWGILKQREFDIPIIVVGNIAVGGTGKTPHAEYIISKLISQYKIAVLSRGYKRATKGFVLATPNSNPDDIGDEPYQVYKKFHGKIRLAVCENRCVGIDELRKIYPDIELFILDDAFQHRHVKPDISIILMEFNRMPYNDHYLPYGHLRESVDALRRASMVIVSKCSDDAKSLDYRLIKKNLELFPSQGLFYSKYAYKNLGSVFPETSQYMPYLDDYTEEDTILAITGIANPKPFTKYLRSYKAKVKAIRFADHHNFERDDLDFINNKFKSLPGFRKVIITTEKDAVRMANNPYFPEDLKKYVFYLPINIEFIPFLNEDFDERLMRDIREVIKLKKQSINK